MRRWCSRLAMLFSIAAVLFVAGCETYDSVSMHMNASYGYYGGGGWYDPYYNRRPGYGRPLRPPMRPPAYRPPYGGGRPSNLPSMPRPSLR